MRTHALTKSSTLIFIHHTVCAPAQLIKAGISEGSNNFAGSKHLVGITGLALIQGDQNRSRGPTRYYKCCLVHLLGSALELAS